MLTFSQVVCFSTLLLQRLTGSREKEDVRRGYGVKLHVITRKLLGALDVK